MPCAFPRAKNGMQWDELGRVPIADIARHRRDRERQNPENSRDRESKSLPLIDADDADQEKIGTSGNLGIGRPKPQPPRAAVLHGGSEIGREKGNRLPVGKRCLI